MMHLYRVRMACDHVETRRMREATAGISWSETAELRSSSGTKCRLCRAQEICERVYEWSTSRDAGQHGPWTDAAGKMVKGSDAEHVVREVWEAMPGNTTWTDAFFRVMRGQAEETLRPSPKCTTCGRPALTPFRRYDSEALRIVEGCIDACHGPHVRHADKAWHDRPEAEAHRAAVAAHRAEILGLALEGVES